MSNALHDYAKLFEKYAANNGGMGVILAGEDCLSLANEMRIDADAIDVENIKLRELVKLAYDCATSGVSCRDCDLVFGEGRCQLKSDLESIGIEVDK